MMTREEYTKSIEMLNIYTEAYDKGTPIISDKEWDDLYFKCEAYEEETGYRDPKSPTSTIQYDIKTSLSKKTHDHPMLSLDKTREVAVLQKWLKEPTIVMLKMDGLTCSLRYENGKLISAETRGNGKVGEDITANAMRLPSIPKTIKCKDTIVVDGEVICTFKDFEEFSDSYKNPRNFAAGSINLDDPNECEKRKLTFVAWDLITGNEDLSTKLDMLKKYGFVVVDYQITDTDNLEIQQNEMKSIAAKKSYPIDGLVYKINNHKSYMDKGYDDHAFKGGFAFKFTDVEYETELTGIEWSVAKTGTITPVALFKTVKIDGASISRASMHNLTVMKNLLGEHPYVGQKIWVIRANMVIPQVKRAEKNTI